VSPIFFEEELPILSRSAFSESPVKGPDGAVDVRTQALVHGVNVAERGGIEKDGVPGWLGAAGFGIAVESQVGGEPGGIDEIAEVGKILEKIRSEERGGGEDDEFASEFSVACEDANAAERLGNAMNHLTRADVRADALEEAAGDPAVTFGPGERTFFVGLAGRKIVD